MQTLREAITKRNRLCSLMLEINAKPLLYRRILQQAAASHGPWGWYSLLVNDWDGVNWNHGGGDYDNTALHYAVSQPLPKEDVTMEEVDEAVAKCIVAITRMNDLAKRIKKAYLFIDRWDSEKSIASLAGILSYKPALKSFIGLLQLGRYEQGVQLSGSFDSYMENNMRIKCTGAVGMDFVNHLQADLVQLESELETNTRFKWDVSTVMASVAYGHTLLDPSLTSDTSLQGLHNAITVKGFKAYQKSMQVAADGQAVVYFPSEEYAKRGRAEVVTLGRFLSKEYKDMPDAVKQEIVNMMRISEPVFTKKYDDIYDAYVNSGIRSCMSGLPCHFEATETEMPAPDSAKGYYIHPVWCYAENPDISLCTITQGGRVTARAIVNMTSKKFLRVYGDYGLVSKLTSMGYEESGDYLCGVTLRTLLTEDGYVLHPYVDGDYSTADGLDEDCTELVLDYRGDYDLQNTDGGTGVSFRRCDHCCGRMRESFEVHVSSARHTDDWCEHCHDHHASEAGVSVDGDGDIDEMARVADWMTSTCDLTGQTVHDDLLIGGEIPEARAKYDREQEEENEDE